jgi:carboxyl-terminal processing protease
MSTSPSSVVSLSSTQRRDILDRILATLQKRFYAPERLGESWLAKVRIHRPVIEAAQGPADFEQAVSDLLAELQTSHLGFFHSSARRASSRAALSATYLTDETSYGKRWIFQDVHNGGAASIAGIRPGDILLTVNGEAITPPEHPVFAMGEKTVAEVLGANDQKSIVSIDVAKPKGTKLHFVEPKLVEARRLDEGIGYLKVAMFPGLIGVEVSNEISCAIETLGDVSRLIIDLRGNTGGGIGALRVMSLLTPESLPVGFALDKNRVPRDLDSEKQTFKRFHGIPTSKRLLWLSALRYGPAMLTKSPILLETEGLGRKSFHGSIVLLVDRHTASAAEMIVAFARENQLATVVGEKTAGRLLSATSVKVGQGYRLALPTGAYYTWKGLVLEGLPIEPDKLVVFDWRERRLGIDRQLELAIDHLCLGRAFRTA